MIIVPDILKDPLHTIARGKKIYNRQISKAMVAFEKNEGWDGITSTQLINKQNKVHIFHGTLI